MKLLRSQIKNFRSIADLQVDFEPRCRVLIGINESGKSNILRALHLLDPEVKVRPSDLRVERLDEDQVTTGWIHFVFQLEPPELQELAKLLSANFMPASFNKPLFDTENGVITARQWSEISHEAVHIISLPQGTRRNTSWSPLSTTKILPGWVRNKSAAPYELSGQSQTISIAPSVLAWIDKLPTPLPETLEHATPSIVYSTLYAAIGKLIASRLPTCIFWKYSDEYLLPSSVDISAFCSAPDTCVPLKSMFELAGYDISKLAATIATARQQGHYRYSQILEKTAHAATQHIRHIWKEYSGVRFKLEPNGDQLAPIVVDDHVPMDMANRSDGFKRFVSFLLQISAKVRTTELTDALILVDEPEIALHPSGCKHLTEELVRIGESNAVVYSTHSIFMIDRDNVDRHLVVEKKKEVTTVWQAEKSRIQDEEVLYSAMGYSVFETLKQKNIIFEGWRDKYIYQVTRDAMCKSDADLRNRLSSIGITHASGVKDIRNVAKFMELAGRPCLIISDADAPAVQHRRQYEEPTAWGEWKTLQDIFGPGSIVTAEDLFTIPTLVKKANKFRSEVAGLEAITEAHFAAGGTSLSVLAAWIRSAGVDEAAFNETLSRLKAALFEKLKRSDLRDQVETLVNFVDQHAFG